MCSRHTSQRHVLNTHVRSFIISHCSVIALIGTKTYSETIYNNSKATIGLFMHLLMSKHTMVKLIQDPDTLRLYVSVRDAINTCSKFISL